MLQAVNFRDVAYWSGTDAHMREKILFFREMLRACLHVSLTNRAVGEILQIMQEALLEDYGSMLTQTPLFRDASGILSWENGQTCEKSPVAERIALPFTTDLTNILFVNTLPCQSAGDDIKIVCTSVQDYLHVVPGLSLAELPRIGMADMAASSLFLHELSQPDLFRPLAANETWVRGIAARKYAVVVAELPRKRPLPSGTYGGKEFLHAWLESLERILLPNGVIYLTVADKFLVNNRWQNFRDYLAANFGTIRVCRMDTSGKTMLLLRRQGKTREFYAAVDAVAEPLLITANGWLAASEQPFFEGRPLSEALEIPYELSSSDHALAIHFREPIADPAAVVADAIWQRFIAHYKFEEQYEHEQALLAETALTLTDTDDLLNCRVHPELGQELRRWVQWAESKDALQLVKKIEQPDFTLAKQFAAIAKLFADIERKFERLAERAASDKESMTVLTEWFAQRAAAIAQLEAFFDRPDFDAPARGISKTDMFYYIFALIQSGEYTNRFQRLLQHFEPRVYPAHDFWEWVAGGAELWKKYNQSI